TLLLVLSLAVPSGQSRPDGPNEFPLAGLWHFLAAHPVWGAAAGWPLPTPQRGGPTNGPHSVPVSATRANGGSGNKPSKTPGSLDEYQTPAHKSDGEWTSPKAVVGFDPSTSVLSQKDTTAKVSVYLNADGSVTRRVHQGPVNFKGSDGLWHPIDLTLRRQSGGGLQSAAGSTTVRFASSAPVAVSAGQASAMDASEVSNTDVGTNLA